MQRHVTIAARQSLRNLEDAPDPALCHGAPGWLRKRRGSAAPAGDFWIDYGAAELWPARYWIVPGSGFAAVYRHPKTGIWTVSTARTLPNDRLIRPV